MGYTKDDTLKNLKGLIKNKNLCVISGCKDSCMIIMNKKHCIHELQELLEEGIIRLTNEQSKTFQSFLHQNLKN